MKRLIPTTTVLFALILTACGKQETPQVGVICNPGTYAMRQKALGEVFEATVNGNHLAVAMKVQRLIREVSEVCQIADHNRARIFVTNGASMDPQNRVWVLPTVKSNMARLTTELQAWAAAPIPVTSSLPVDASDLPDSVKSRMVLSGTILITEKLIDFGDL